MKHQIMRSDFGGRDLNRLFAKLLKESDSYLARLLDMETLRTIKEENCYVALNYEDEIK